MNKKRQVKRALRDLGRSPEKIAESLRSASIKGDHSPSSCPVARYLRTRFPDESVVAASSHVMVGTTDVKSTAAVKEFIIRFDIGDYDDLGIVSGYL